MTKNIIQEITKLLGVEIGEEFKVIDTHENECTVRFIENNLQVFDDVDKNWRDFMCAIGYIVSGEYEIVKLPWKPKFNDKYWTFMSSDFVVRQSSWKDNAGDYTRLKCGCVFRTEEEAIKERPHIYKELTGKEWEDE